MLNESGGTKSIQLEPSKFLYIQHQMVLHVLAGTGYTHLRLVQHVS